MDIFKLSHMSYTLGKMRFPFLEIVAFLLLKASVSSFGSVGVTKNTWVRAFSRTVVANRIPFVTGGGSSRANGLSASFDNTSTTLRQMISEENLDLLSKRGRDAILRLIEYDSEGLQKHVYGGWPEAGVEDEGKKRLGDQVSRQITCVGYRYIVKPLSKCIGVSWQT
jgi:hypothetical protein